MPKFVHVNPSEVIVLHSMTLQDLANCLNAFRASLGSENFKALPTQVIEMLQASYERVQHTLRRCEHEEAKKHLADDECVGDIRETHG